MPLRDPVTHGRHPTGKLRHRPGCGHRLLDRAWDRFIRLVRREHVVVGRHNRDVGLDVAAQVVLGARFAGREPMGQVRAAQVQPGWPAAGGPADTLEIPSPRLGAAHPDPLGDVADNGMQYGRGQPLPPWAAAIPGRHGCRDARGFTSTAAHEVSSLLTSYLRIPPPPRTPYATCVSRRRSNNAGFGSRPAILDPPATKTLVPGEIAANRRSAGPNTGRCWWWRFRRSGRSVPMRSVNLTDLREF